MFRGEKVFFSKFEFHGKPTSIFTKQFNQMKIEIRNEDVVYIERGDYTFYIDFSIDGETIISKFDTDDDSDVLSPTITWENANDIITILPA